MNKKYSIIIPVYNSEKTINKCLSSILCQDTRLFEVIIVNDGSTDDSVKLCQSYKNKYNNIRIINQINKGPSAARNNAILEALGEYIIFVDSDDYISEDFFKNIDKYVVDDLDILKYNVNYIGNRVDNNIFNTMSFCFKNGESTLEYFIDSKKIFATPWMFVFRKKLFIDNNLFFAEKCIHEDYGLIPCLIIMAKKIKGIEYVGYNYVYTEGSLSTNQSYDFIAKRAFDMLVHYDYLLDFSNKKIKNEIVEEKFNKYIKKNLLQKVYKLNDEDKKIFIKELKKRNLTM